MTGFLDKLNLKPQERRLVVIVAIVVFVVLNFWFIFPVFGALGKMQRRIIDERALLAKYQLEVNKAPAYRRLIADLQNDGQVIPTEQQGGDLLRDVQNLSRATKVNITRYDFRDRGSSLQTNAFFDEKSLVVTIVGTGEKELIDFLFRISSHEMPTRLRAITLSPDPPRQKLAGSATFVRSYQRKPASRSATATPSSGTPSPGPASAPAPSTTAPAPPETNSPAPSGPTTSPTVPSRVPPRTSSTTQPEPDNPPDTPSAAATPVRRELPRRTPPSEATP